MSRSSSDSQVPAGPAAGLCKGKGWAAGRPPARWAFSLAISMASAATRGDPAESAERQAAVTEAAVTRLAMHGYHENKDAYSMADYVAYIGAMKAVTEAAPMPDDLGSMSRPLLPQKKAAAAGNAKAQERRAHFLVKKLLHVAGLI